MNFTAAWGETDCLSLTLLSSVLLTLSRLSHSYEWKLLQFSLRTHKNYMCFLYQWAEVQFSHCSYRLWGSDYMTRWLVCVLIGRSWQEVVCSTGRFTFLLLNFDLHTPTPVLTPQWSTRYTETHDAWMCVRGYKSWAVTVTGGCTTSSIFILHIRVDVYQDYLIVCFSMKITKRLLKTLDLTGFKQFRQSELFSVLFCFQLLQQQTEHKVKASVLCSMKSIWL